MNILQSFMGCMYPGSIRTVSIESMDQENPDCRFQAALVDHQFKERTRGELHVTDKDLRYFTSRQVPIRFPFECIRKFGCDKEGLFILEVGRHGPRGEGIFGFRLSRASELVKKLQEETGICPQNKKDACTSTDDSTSNQPNQPRMSYTLIDFEKSKALNEAHQAHTASRFTTQ